MNGIRSYIAAGISELVYLGIFQQTETRECEFFVVTRPAADATDAPQP
jgi:hypothetical protein